MVGLNSILYEAESLTESLTETVSDSSAEASSTVSEVVQWFTQEWWLNLANDAWGWCKTTGVKVVIALILLFISFKLVNLFTRRLYKKFQRKKYDETLSRVSTNIMRISLKITIGVFLIGFVGIEIASLSAIIATMGVGISLAVQGTLSNFAGGVILVIMRPFKIGDFITSNGESGTVEDIKLFYTHIVSPDNKVIYIPNGSLANNVIVNVSAKEDRRVDVIMSVSYDSNIELCKNLIRKVAANNELIFKSPEPFAQIVEYADSSINLTCRVWCKNKDYWTVKFYLLNEIKNEFDANGIEIPFNQLDVTIKNQQLLEDKKIEN